jgi:FlgD Ig-like domain
VIATSSPGRASSMERSFSLNLTLCCGKTSGPSLAVPRARPRAVALFTLAHPAVISARIETKSGVVVRRLPGAGRTAEGGIAVDWDGRTDSGAIVYSGRYVARLTARNELGTVSLTAPFTVRRVARAR